jgi:hypothetical protein
MTGAASDIILERMMALHPKIIDLTLDRVWRLLEALGNPQDRLPPVIHIAGTNGKGSTLAMIRAGLEADGQRVHAYTSPHLARFHERIRLGGTLISEPDLAALLDRCYAANGGEAITYFEITTCAALLAFAETPADVTLLEVGLGGRLDATNVVDRPAACVITPVSYDHQQFLGETLPAIAGEKAGIIKRGVPCVVGPQEEAALDVIEAVAARVGAPLLVHGQHWQVSEERGRLVYQDETGLLDLPLPALPGAHQVQTAFVVAQIVGLVGVDEGQIDIPPFAVADQRIQCVEGRRDAQVDALPDAGLAPVRFRHRGPLGADVTAHDAARGRQRRGHRKRAVAGEGADLEDLFRPGKLHQQRHELALLRRDLHVGFFQSHRHLAQSALHVVFPQRVIEDVLVQRVVERRGSVRHVGAPSPRRRRGR